MKCWICGKKADPSLIFHSNRMQEGSCLKRSSYQKTTGWCTSCYKAEEARTEKATQDSLDALRKHAEENGIDTSEWVGLQN